MEESTEDNDNKRLFHGGMNLQPLVYTSDNPASYLLLLADEE